MENLLIRFLAISSLDFKFPNEPLTQKRLEIAMINKLNDIQ